MRKSAAIWLILAMALFTAACSGQKQPAAQAEAEARKTAEQRAAEIQQVEARGKSLLAKNPADPQGYLLLGSAAYRRDQIKQAAEHYQKAIELDPKNADAYNLLGNSYRDLGRPDEAESAYRKALELDPRHSAAAANLATFFRLQNRMEEAAKVLKAAVQANPHALDLWVMLGNTHASMGKHDEAKAAFQEALKLYPGYESALKGLRALEPGVS